MSFGGDCLINKINERIAALEGSTYSSAQLAGSVRSSLEKSVYSVLTENDLPSAQCNKGRFVYVQDIQSFRYSDGYYWTKDGCSVLGNINTATSLWSWGSCGVALGNGTTVSRRSPGTLAGAGTNWCQVSAGNGRAAAIKTDGTLWTWGCNCQGRLGNGTTTNRCSPGTVAGGGTTWCQVSMGRNHGAAIKTDGTIWTWGSNSVNATGALGDGTVTDRCSPGTVAGGGTNWCQVSAGYFNISAIKCDGTLWTWGSNYAGILGDGTVTARCSPGTVAGGGTNWCLISVGDAVTSAIKCDGTLWTWGENNCGQLGNGTVTLRCSPGTVAGAGTNWCQVSAAYIATSAIKTDGTLWTWGCNRYGKLGDGTTTNRCSPGTVAGGGTTWCQVSGTTGNTAAIKTDGTIWTWGTNFLTSLGDGTTVSRCSPGTIAGGGNIWCRISVGNFNILALKSRGF